MPTKPSRLSDCRSSTKPASTESSHATRKPPSRDYAMWSGTSVTGFPSLRRELDQRPEGRPTLKLTRPSHAFFRRFRHLPELLRARRHHLHRLQKLTFVSTPRHDSSAHFHAHAGHKLGLFFPIFHYTYTTWITEAQDCKTRQTLHRGNAHLTQTQPGSPRTRL